MIAGQPAEWYDAQFEATPSYQCAYYDSRYYFLWSVIVDRVLRSGLRRVLEIGCGTGQLAACFLDRGIDTYVGLDFSTKAIEFAQQAAPGARFIVADARTSDAYTEEAHDVLVCTEVLEHIPEDLAVVARFRPGVRCLFSVPSYESASHVRTFKTGSAVIKRYGRYFDSLEVVAFPLAPTAAGPNTMFLADGVRGDAPLRSRPTRPTV